MSEASEPVLRRARPDEDEAIAACIAESFPDNPKSRLDVLRWQYRENPFGPTPSWVWDDGGRIVAHYSSFPMPCLVDGRAAVAGNAVDAAVAPSHQGRRLFTPLAEALYADSRELGHAVTYCFGTNWTALRGVARAGWMEVARLRVFALPLDDAWVARRTHLPRPVAGAARRLLFHVGRGPVGARVEGPPEGLDALWDRWARTDSVRNGVIRDAEWWDWRYGRSPLGPYRYVEVRGPAHDLRAAAVLTVRDERGGRFGEVLELVAVDAEAARAALRAAASDGDLTGLVSVAFPKGTSAALLADAGMRVLPRRLEPRATWFGFVDTAGAHAHLREQSWGVSRGDQDHL
jgi:predicted N-acetyltransferase YhbS